MLTEIQARLKVKRFLPDAKVKSWAKYRHLYLYRVEYPSPLEKDFDPFFSVDSDTGTVRDFSVITDADISDIAALNWADI
jgi:hypothetical protein